MPMGGTRDNVYLWHSIHLAPEVARSQRLCTVLWSIVRRACTNDQFHLRAVVAPPGRVDCQTPFVRLFIWKRWCSNGPVRRWR
jgi:hypothetical protein